MNSNDNQEKTLHFPSPSSPQTPAAPSPRAGGKGTDAGRSIRMAAARCWRGRWDLSHGGWGWMDLDPHGNLSDGHLGARTERFWINKSGRTGLNTVEVVLKYTQKIWFPPSKCGVILQIRLGQNAWRASSEQLSLHCRSLH